MHGQLHGQLQAAGSYRLCCGDVVNRRLGGPRLGQVIKLIMKYWCKAALLYSLGSCSKVPTHPHRPMALAGMGLPCKNEHLEMEIGLFRQAVGGAREGAAPCCTQVWFQQSYCPHRAHFKFHVG